MVRHTKHTRAHTHKYKHISVHENEYGISFFPPRSIQPPASLRSQSYCCYYCRLRGKQCWTHLLYWNIYNICLTFIDRPAKKRSQYLCNSQNVLVIFKSSHLIIHDEWNVSKAWQFLVMLLVLPWPSRCPTTTMWLPLWRPLLPLLLLLQRFFLYFQVPDISPSFGFSST